ncbi:MAG: 2-phospho-L-lactate guanylyltransferase [Alphaproteobacteria bacterium]|nr:2-phospho-L-lactate guanylyltransferase [Alphaproteobacteria bacterium]
MQASTGHVWAVIPVKPFADAKQRLSELLTSQERRELARAMFEDVMVHVMAARGLAGVVVVTRDRLAAARARRAGATVLIEASAEGQSAAVQRAAEMLLRHPRAVLLTVPGDLPAISTADIEALMNAHGKRSGVTLVPARDNCGTNALVASPPTALPFRFGADSFRRHLREAHRAGLEAQVTNLSGLELDIDTPADLWELIARGATGRTAEVLASIPLATRRLGGASAVRSVEAAT